jgi:hypothetical protein
LQAGNCPPLLWKFVQWAKIEKSVLRFGVARHRNLILITSVKGELCWSNPGKPHRIKGKMKQEEQVQLSA